MAQTCLISHHEKLGHTTDNFVALPGSSRAGMIFGFCLKTGFFRAQIPMVHWLELQLGVYVLSSWTRPNEPREGV